MENTDSTVSAEPTAENGNIQLLIATHSGPFHADDVFAVAAFRRGIGQSTRVVRTRDPKILKAAHCCIDVGGEHNPELYRFDHHQRGGAGVRENSIPYAAFGLVWAQLGAHYVASLVHGEDIQQRVADKVDAMLVQSIDAADNGVRQGSGFTVSLMVHQMNPTWNLKPDEADFDASFNDACELAQDILDKAVMAAYAEVASEDLVRQALDRMHAQGQQVMVLDQYCDWLETTVQDQKVQFVVFPATDGTWMAQCVPPEFGSFEQRTPHLEEWAGLRDQELQELSGVPDAVFCHPGRFIAGAGTKEGAIDLALHSLARVYPATAE